MRGFAIYVQLDGAVWFPDHLGIQERNPAICLLLEHELNVACSVYLVEMVGEVLDLAINKALITCGYPTGL